MTARTYGHTKTGTPITDEQVGDAAASATARAHDAERWTGDPELLVADAAWAWRDLR